MGRCKAELPWLNGTTLLSYQIEQLLMAGITPVVVLGPHNAQLLKPWAAPGQVVINYHPEAGKVSSIVTGLKHIPRDFQALMIVAVDQPRPQWIYQTLLQAHLSANVPLTAPAYKGRTGHPLVFSTAVWMALEGLSEETLGLRQIVQVFSERIHYVEFETADVLMDLNTPESYQAALLRYSSQTFDEQLVEW